MCLLNVLPQKDMLTGAYRTSMLVTTRPKHHGLFAICSLQGSHDRLRHGKAHVPLAEGRNHRGKRQSHCFAAESTVAPDSQKLWCGANEIQGSADQ